MKNFLLALAVVGSLTLASCGGSISTPNKTKTDSVSVTKDSTHASVDTTKRDSVHTK